MQQPGDGGRCLELSKRCRDRLANHCVGVVGRCKDRVGLPRLGSKHFRRRGAHLGCRVLAEQPNQLGSQRLAGTTRARRNGKAANGGFLVPEEPLRMGNEVGIVGWSHEGSVPLDERRSVVVADLLLPLRPPGIVPANERSFVNRGSVGGGYVSDIVVQVADGLCTITLNRPDKLNSFTKTMLESFLEALETAAADPAIRAVIITGEGRGFCAGQDLSDRAVAPGDEAPDLGESLENRYNPAVRLIRSMPKPVIVAVNGVAAGAGANLAMTGDIVIAARSARFIQSFARIGLLPDSGGTFFLPRRVGAARAMGLALLAEPLDAETAAAWGLIWEVVDDEELLDVATELGRSLAEGPTAGYAAIKEALNASLGNNLDTQLDLERDLQRRSGLTADYGEGVRAFMEKRPPRFEGR